MRWMPEYQVCYEYKVPACLFISTQAKYTYFSFIFHKKTVKNNSFDFWSPMSHFWYTFRRKEPYRGDMIDTYKYLTGAYTTSRLKLELHSGRETRGNSLKLAKHRSRLQLRSSYFSQRVVSLWNSLPETVTEVNNLNTFKSRLDAHWPNIPILYDPQCNQWALHGQHLDNH